MKHDLEDLLRHDVRRELREAPAGLAARVEARLDFAPREPAARASRLPFALAAGLAAAALAAWIYWPRSVPLKPEVAGLAPAPSAPALAVGLTQKGLEYASRVDQPLADEWHLMVQDSVQLYDSLVAGLPTLPR